VLHYTSRTTARCRNHLRRFITDLLDAAAAHKLATTAATKRQKQDNKKTNKKDSSGSLGGAVDGVSYAGSSSSRAGDTMVANVA
jgi:hypothetical protein